MTKNSVKAVSIAGIRAIFLLIIIVAILLGAFFWRAKSLRDASVIYQTVPVVARDINQEVLAFGKLHASQLVSVGAQVGGQIVKIQVQLGDRLKKGSLVAEIDSASQRNALKSATENLRQAQSQLEANEATLKHAIRTFKRQQELFENDINTKQDLESAELAKETAKANVAAQRSIIRINQLSVETARTNIGYTRILAPIDGQVVAVLAAEGQTVNANQVTPNLVLLANVDVMTVRIRISESDVGKIKSGQTAKFTLLGGIGREYESVIKSIDPAPDSIVNETRLAPTSARGGGSGGAVYYTALMEMKNTDDSLKLSMTASVRIAVAESKSVLSVPLSALLSANSENIGVVETLVDGQAVVKQIHLGISDSIYVEVLEGLELGDQVILKQLPLPTSVSRFGSEYGFGG